MNRSMMMTGMIAGMIKGRRSRSFATSLLLVGLFLSSSAFLSAKIQFGQTAEQPGPTAIRSTTTPARDYALKTPSGQRISVDLSKQNRVKHLVVYGGLATEDLNEPATARQFLVSTGRSVLYLSFRLTRPGGRAPPLA
jgi:hypothetical protein